MTSEVLKILELFDEKLHIHEHPSEFLVKSNFDTNLGQHPVKKDTPTRDTDFIFPFYLINFTNCIKCMACFAQSCFVIV